MRLHDICLNNMANVACRTSGENIGDTGLIQAYRAWRGQQVSLEQTLLPGLEYTQYVLVLYVVQ